jgi:putative sterol carrier protein
VSDGGLLPFSPAWADAVRTAIEADAAYREAAARWTWPVALILEPAPALGFPDAVALHLTLDRGRCHRSEIRPAEGVEAPFVLRASYETWKAIVQGRLDVIQAVIQRRVAVQGQLTTLMLHAKAALALVACARGVPTRFPDEP